MGRKVSFEEKKAIVQWTIDHDKNYQAAAEKFDVSYQRLYSWVRKYLKKGDWNALEDLRGKNKDKEPTTELERLRKQNRELKKKQRKQDVQLNYEKRLANIHSLESSQTKRHQVIQEMIDEGYSVSEVTRAAGITRQAFYKWKKSHNNN